MEHKGELIEKLKKQIDDFAYEWNAKEIGEISEVFDGVARVAGLKESLMSEMVKIEAEDGKEIADGVIFNLEEHSVGIVILSDYTAVKEGMTVRPTGKILSTPVSEDMIGRVIDPLGRPIDGKGKISAEKRYPVEKIAPGVIQREPIQAPLQTGIKAIDAMIPIGRGQRELIIGDRQTGKTAVAIDTIINQKNEGVISIYVAIGQKESKVARIVARLEKEGAMKNTIVISAPASSPSSMQYIAPYSGTAIGEYFMDQGKDVLIVYDDLSKHAWAYREISLLLKRPPGREAYPGDIFYLHSRLLERSAKLSRELGGGSLTALPIIETQSGDVSAYIPTNVISITDGQIYLESDLFYRGIRPAVNVGLSVSRVGGDAQIKAMKKVAGRLRLQLAQFRELEAFAQFSSDLDEDTRMQIERGRRLTEILKQKQYEPLPVVSQAVTLYAVINGYCDDISVDNIKAFEEKLVEYLNTKGRIISEKLTKEKELTKDSEESLKKMLSEFKKGFTI